MKLGVLEFLGSAQCMRSAAVVHGAGAAIIITSRHLLTVVSKQSREPVPDFGRV